MRECPDPFNRPEPFAVRSIAESRSTVSRCGVSRRGQKAGPRTHASVQMNFDVHGRTLGIRAAGKDATPSPFLSGET